MYKDVAKKILVGLLTICMVAGMVDLSAFTVQAAGDLHFEDDGVLWYFDYAQSVEYNGTVQEPPVTIYPINADSTHGTPLVLGTDYRVEYNPDTNVNASNGGGEIKVIGQNRYEGSVVNLNFTIRKKNLGTSSDITVDAIGPQSYTGAAISPDIVVRDNGTPLIGVRRGDEVSGTTYDYTYTCSNNINPGTQSAVVTITGGGGNYTGTNNTARFDIVQLDPSRISVSGLDARYSYTGAPIYPEPQVEYDGTPLIKDTDFRFLYGDNTKAGTGTVRIVGLNAYAGLGTSEAYSFSIIKSIRHSDISIAPIEDQVYTGSNIEIDPNTLVITDSDRPGHPLEPGVDFEISGYEGDRVAIGDAMVTIKGIGVYTLTKSIPFSIVAATLANTDVSIAECTYDGTAQEPAVTVSRGSIIYGPSDYNVGYSSNTAAGVNTGIATITGTGSLSSDSPRVEHFTIGQRSLEDGNVTMTLVDYNVNAKYTGAPVEPRVKLTYRQGDGSVVELVETRDYVLRYQDENGNSDSTNAGRKKVIAEGRGNFKDTKSIGYTIDPASMIGATIDEIDSRTYTGGEQNPGVRVWLDGNLLTRYSDITGTGDYTVTYENNINAGVNTAVVKVTGCGNYSAETVTKTFTIDRKNLNSAGISISPIANPTYTGRVQRPDVTIRYNGMTLNENRIDFTVTYGDETTNRDAGTNTGKLTIEGQGNYEGTVLKDFSILKRDIRTGDFLSVVNLEPIYAYTGGEIRAENLEVYYRNPTAGVEMNSMLSPVTDYHIGYQTNTAIGPATLQVIANENNYTGTKNFTFAIKGNLEDTDKTEIVIPPQTYTGSPIEPTNIAIRFNGVLLRKGTDYQISFNGTEPGTGEATIVGANNYIGNVIQSFDINKKNLDDVTESSRDFVINGIDPAGYEYNGYPIEPTLSIDYNGISPAPASGTDYELQYNDSNKAGTASVTITGRGNHFEGSTQRNYQIHPYNIEQESSDVTLSGVVENVVMEDLDGTPGIALQDGAVVQTGLVVTYHCTNPVTGVSEDRVLTEGEDRDYTVSYETNTEIGTAAVIIEGKGNFTGRIRKEFKIRGDLSRTGSIQIIPTWSYVPDLDGECRNTPLPVVRYNGILLSPETDYSISYTDNDGVGSATVTITANPDGNYINGLQTGFTITERVLSLEDEELIISGLEENGYEYTGSPIVPALTVTYMGAELTTDDIVITAEHNVNVPGEGASDQPVVKIAAKPGGNYADSEEGAIEIPFIINPRVVSEDTIRVEGIAAGYDYDGGNEVKIPDGDLQLYYQSETIPLVVGDGGDYDIEYHGNHDIGTAAITITGKGNYSGTIERNFFVVGDLAADYITIAEIEPVPYGIVAVTPTLVIIDSSTGEEKTLVLDTDYRVTSCINNINVASKDSANPPTVTIEGMDCYKGTFTGTFDIIPKNLSEDTGDITAAFAGSINNDEVSDAFVYTGTAIQPAVTVYNHGAEMAAGIDYTVRGYVNNTEVPDPDAPEDMRPGVIIDAVENGNYLGTKIIRFNIIPKDISDVDISFTGESTFTYDRTAKTPEVAVTYMGDDGEAHDFPSENYEIGYQFNTEAGSPADGSDAPAVVITGKGNFTGTQVKPFTILPEDIGELNTDITAEAASAVYTGSPLGTTVTLTAADGTVLAESDYELRDYTSNTNAGTAYVMIQGLGNYTGSRSVPFTIGQKSISSEDITVSGIDPQGYGYTAAEIKPEPVVTVGTGDSAIRLGDQDYELSWRSNTDAGTGYVVITGKDNGNYGGSRDVPFTINKKSIGTDGTIDSAMTMQDIADQLYTGGLVKPGVTLEYHGSVTQTLLEERDYKITYGSNVAVGTSSVLITGYGNFEGSIRTSFRIKGNMAAASVAQIPVQGYTGSEVKPLPTVILGGKTLVKDTDYEVTYDSNIDRGTATITITGIGEWYTGSKTVNFVIAREFSSEMKIAGLASTYTYTGKAVTPSVRVTDYGSVLTEGRDYKLSYSSNIKAGTAKVTVTGIGEYDGSKSANFKIIERNIGQCAVTNIGNQNYTGKKVSPTAKVTYGGMTLKAGTDYTIVYTNNVKAGRANAIIKGKGNFIGTKTIGYNIVIPKVSSVKGSSSTSSVKISWKKNSVVTGYEIYTSSNKLVARLSKTKTSYTISKRKPGRTYTYKIRAYAVKDGATKRSSFVTVKVSTKPASTSITSISSSKSKQVVLKWKKVSGATDYTIYRSTSKNGTYKSIGTTKSSVYIDKKATGGRTYYYKVRVRRTVDKKNYYSSYSAKKAIKAKK